MTKKKIIEKKGKPRGSPFVKGNQIAKLNCKTRQLVEFRNAIELVAKEGLSVKEACAKAGLAFDTFWGIRNSDPRLNKVYYEALRMRNDHDVEKVRSDVLTCDKDTAFLAKIKTDFIKWHSGKLNPTVYGDVDQRPPVNLEIKIGNELLTVTGGEQKKK